MTSRWPYLKDPTFETRYILAGWYLKDCSTVVEIGAEELTIDNYIPNRNSIIIVNGPNLKNPWERAFRLKLRFEEIHWSILEPGNMMAVRHPVMKPVKPIKEAVVVNLEKCRYGVALLGLELMMPQAKWRTLYTLLNKAEKVVVEFTEGHIHSVKQATMIQRNLKELGKHFSFVLELPGNKHGRRRMIVYERKDR